MNKIFQSYKDALTQRINISVKPEFADSFQSFLEVNNHPYISDGQLHTDRVVGLGQVSCRAFLLNFSEELRRDVIAWDETPET